MKAGSLHGKATGRKGGYGWVAGVRGGGGGGPKLGAFVNGPKIYKWVAFTPEINGVDLGAPTSDW